MFRATNLFLLFLILQISGHRCMPNDGAVIGVNRRVDGTPGACPCGGNLPDCDSCGCFPSKATVKLENGKTIQISELQIGDQVQIGKNGLYSEVRTFMKKQHTVTNMYKSITTSDNNIHLTGDHLIYSRRSVTEKFNPVYAAHVSTGDEVLVIENDKLVPTNVLNISSIMMEGAYTPLTMEGDIVVDGVFASCYATVSHDPAHIGLMPIRWFPEVAEWIFGEYNGFPVSSDIAQALGKWIAPYSQRNVNVQ